MKKGLLSCWVIILAIVGILFVGVAVMFFANICPPQGPWPMPPWCGEDSWTFSIPIPPTPPQEIPSIEQISEIPTLPKVELTETPELVIEEAVVIPTRIEEIPYPDFYNNPPISKAVVRDPYCALTREEVAYPIEYLAFTSFHPWKVRPCRRLSGEPSASRTSGLRSQISTTARLSSPMKKCASLSTAPWNG